MSPRILVVALLAPLALALVVAPVAEANPLDRCRTGVNMALEDGSQLWEGVCTNIFDRDRPIYPCAAVEVETDLTLAGPTLP